MFGERATLRVTRGTLAMLSALLCAVALSSLAWRMDHDSPLMLYPAFLVNELGFAPYRDLFDLNAPGTLVFNMALGRLFGYGDLGFRIADLLLLVVTSLATWRALRPLGGAAGWLAAVLWGLTYLGYGQRGSLQRDYIIVSLLSIALWIAFEPRFRSSARKALACGIVLGAAATLKPHAWIGLPLFAAYLAAEEPPGAVRWRRAAALLAVAGMGMALPLLAVAAYLWWAGGLDGFVDMARNYWPLYAQISGDHSLIRTTGRNLWRGYRRLGRPRALGLLATAAVGAVFASAWGELGSGGARKVKLIAGLALAYLAYVGVSGKFFVYHWGPYHYFLLLLVALCAARLTSRRPLVVRPLPRTVLFAYPKPAFIRLAPVCALLLFVASTVRPPLEFRRYLAGHQLPQPKNGRVDRIAGFLERELAAGDTVQPLDWTGGAVHALLILRARLATSFVYDFHFYHHRTDEFVDGLRWRFIEELRRSPPRFVVEVTAPDKPWLWGFGIDDRFGKLRRFLDSRYDVALRDGEFIIYERR